MSDGGATDAIFNVCPLQEKYIAANKLYYFTFVDLEIACQRKFYGGPQEASDRGMCCACHPVHVLQGPESSSTPVCHGSFSTLMTWCSSWKPRSAPQVKTWEASMKSKWLRVNMKKTRFLVSGVGHGVPKKYASIPVMYALVLVTSPVHALGPQGVQWHY